MGTGTINIGSRQKGRLSATSVIHCPPDAKSINLAINSLYEPSFTKKLSLTVNPYGNGGASTKIVEVLKYYPLENIKKKSFFDIENNL
jgi:GDP/UDP-N,N'-diacetylbacillosamine 2-epimerase (hydrolysing)